MTTKASVKKKLTKYRAKRDFAVTREPSGGSVIKHAKKSRLKFVVQKHAATSLHFDLRLELDGVMKSWAVPKGPSMDPSIKRLAMEVEDHPIEYNTFEGTIPEGEYGGGTVMLWDRGTYAADKPKDGDHEAAIREGHTKGKIDFTLQGKRLHGSFTLVRTNRGPKPKWLLIKHRDEYAEPGSDIVADNMTSVSTRRTMDAIASGKSRVWKSNRKAAKATKKSRKATKTTKKTTKKTAKTASTAATSGIMPMLATLVREMPAEGEWTYEPKYDGVRLLAFIAPGAVRLITRNGKDKTKQFPELVEDMQKLLGRSKRPMVLDGEVVSLVNGEAGRFQDLQRRVHLENSQTIAGLASEHPTVFVAFDLLLDGNKSLLNEPWTKRRAALEKRLARKKLKHLWLAPSRPDGDAMLRVATEQGWEGVIAKEISSRYTPGKRSRSWVKLKLEKQQEFVIGGFTEPRKSRKHIGALLLGYYNNNDDLIYVGHTGGGFSERALQNMYNLLKPKERKTSPFTTTPKTNEKAHWVKPDVVVEVRFNEMTNVGKLRQPVFLGVRDDKDPKDVTLEF